MPLPNALEKPVVPFVPDVLIRNLLAAKPEMPPVAVTIVHE